MEAGLRSRKRKQQSSKSDPFDGIFTRSKSQIYVHRHRSGYARADLIRNRGLIQSPEGTAKSMLKRESSEATVDQIVVKDLRARRVFSPTTMTDETVSVGKVDSVAERDVCKTNDGNPNVLCSEHDVVVSDLGVSDSVANDLKQISENKVDQALATESNVMEADEFVQMTPTDTESDQDKRVEEKNGMISVANEAIDAQGSMSKNQSSVTSLRCRRKVFKSPGSFSYRRLLPYLKELRKDDSSSFEIVDQALPGKVQTSSNTMPILVACTDEEMGVVSDGSKLADCTFNDTKSVENLYSKSVNSNLIRTVESSGLPGVVQTSEGVLNDSAEELEQMTPPDSDIYSKPNIAKSSGAHVKLTDAGHVMNCSNERNASEAASKLVLKPCSRMKVLQIPTSFSHRRLLPFLMSVAKDDSRATKVDQPLKLEKAMEQNQQPTLSVLGQNIVMDESETNNNSGPPSAADEKSDSPTSTLIPADASFDRINAVSLDASENVLDIDVPDTECRRSTSQMEDKPQAEAVNFDSSVKSEQESPDNNLKRAEEANSKAILSNAITSVETLSSICTEQIADTNNDCMKKQKPLNESTDQSSLQVAPLNSPGIYGENFRNGILKRTPLGCRGICNCLNCTSFRLHAERSFEFSRNQMHDAEDVVLELINDLTCLRNILERSASDSSYLATVKEKQVCAKSLYKEEAARARLAQMKEDLSIHCRSMKLLRPKVTFANKIEEKVISKEKEVVVYGKKRV